MNVLPRRREADIVVVGAGAAAAAAAWSLIRHGFSIVCLEQGGWPDPDAYPTTVPDWELHLRGDFSMDPNVRRLPADYPVRADESSITPFMYNAVGGSTIHWGAQFPRFHPSDFRVRSLDGVADDWPLDYRDLEPHYDLNDRMMEVAGLDGDPAYPPKTPRQTPPLPLGRFGETVAVGFDRLGWHWWPSDAAINSTDYDGCPGCNNLRSLRAWLHDSRPQQRRRHLLAESDRQWRRVAHGLPGPACARRPARPGNRRGVRQRKRDDRSDRRLGRGGRVQRHRNAPAAAQFGVT